MYPKDFKAAVRKLTDNVVIASTPFTRANLFHFGARMTLFNYNDKVIVWSAIPYGDEVVRSLKLLTGKSGDFNVSYLIIPDAEHTMAAKSFKDTYPEMKIIAMEGVKVPVKIDYKITKNDGNKLIDAEYLNKLGITDTAIVDNFEFVYLPTHANKELVMYNKPNKILCQADLLLLLGPKGTNLEQYSEETGFPANFNAFTGFSRLIGYSHPDSKVFVKLANKMVKSTNPETKKGLKIIDSWDFSTMIPCHGNVVDDGKSVFRKVFSSVL